MKSKYANPRAVCDKCGREAPKLREKAGSQYPYDTSKPCPCGGLWCTTFEHAEDDEEGMSV